MTTTLRYAMNLRLGLHDIHRAPCTNPLCHKWIPTRRHETGQWGGFYDDCDKPQLCDHCAQRIGQGYKERTERAMKEGTAYVAVCSPVQRESYRRTIEGDYMSVPVVSMLGCRNLSECDNEDDTDKTVVLFHNRRMSYSQIVTQDWVDSYDWTELARQKDPAKYITGDLGKEEEIDDNKEPYRNIGFSFSADAKVEGNKIILECGEQVGQELGLAKSAQEAHKQTQRLEELAREAFLAAKFSQCDYKILHTVSRAEFEVKNTIGICSNSDILEDDVLEIIERFRQKQALAD